MNGGTVCNRGEVVLIPFPFADVTAKKKRPALVISNNIFNRSNSDVICCMITSSPSNFPNEVDINRGDMENGVLPLDSKIKPQRLFTVEKSVIIKCYGKLKDNKTNQVVNIIMKLIN